MLGVNPVWFRLCRVGSRLEDDALALFDEMTSNNLFNLGELGHWYGNLNIEFTQIADAAFSYYTDACTTEFFKDPSCAFSCDDVIGGHVPLTCEDYVVLLGWGVGDICEVNGNEACGGQGPSTSDCDHCCKPSCGDYATSQGWSNPACEWNGNGACMGQGPSTNDCDHCCAEQMPYQPSYDPDCDLGIIGMKCDDGDPCSYNDRCYEEHNCFGTAIECTSDVCTQRNCNGTSSCNEIPLGAEIYEWQDNGWTYAYDIDDEYVEQSNVAYRVPVQDKTLYLLSSPLVPDKMQSADMNEANTCEWCGCPFDCAYSSVGSIGVGFAQADGLVPLHRWVKGIEHRSAISQPDPDWQEEHVLGYVCAP